MAGGIRADLRADPKAWARGRQPRTRLADLSNGGSIRNVPARLAIVSFPGSEADALPRETRTAGRVSATAELTLAMARGSEAAFARFFENYFNRLFRYLLVISRGDETAARDALQDTMTRVAKHVRRFDDEQAFWDWLTVLARSAARDGGRKQTRYRNLLTRFFERAEPAGLSATLPAESEDRLNEALDAALKALSDLERKLIDQKYFQGLSVRELAHLGELTEKAVESRLLRARRTLRETINRQLGDER